MHVRKVQCRPRYPGLPRLLQLLKVLSRPGPQLAAPGVLLNSTPCFHPGHLGERGSDYDGLLYKVVRCFKKGLCLLFLVTIRNSGEVYWTTLSF